MFENKRLLNCKSIQWIPILYLFDFFFVAQTLICFFFWVIGIFWLDFETLRSCFVLLWLEETNNLNDNWNSDVFCLLEWYHPKLLKYKCNITQAQFIIISFCNRCNKCRLFSVLFRWFVYCCYFFNRLFFSSFLFFNVNCVQVVNYPTIESYSAFRLFFNHLNVLIWFGY